MMVGKPPIRCLPSVTEYDTPEKTNVFFVYLNIEYSTKAAK